jgi:WXG100 family type VII secretion target
LQTDSALMEQTARNFEAVDAELQTNLNTLKSKVTALSAGWAGRGAMSFQGTMENWSKQQAAINQLLAETAGLIRTAGGTYASTDSNTANRFNNTGADVRPLPL